MFNMVDKFSTWLVSELNKRNWSQAELARRARVSRASISGLISEIHNPGIDICNGIASAFNLRPEEVYRVAGLLPPSREIDPGTMELAHRISQLPQEDQDFIDTLIITLLNKKGVKVTKIEEVQTTTTPPAKKTTVKKPRAQTT
jgi:transcriptional regulator with XRE-family HTH domain